MAGFYIELTENGVINEFWKVVNDVGYRRARQLFSMAMNKKGRQGYTGVIRSVARQSSIKQKDVRAQMTFRRSSAATLTTTIRGASSAFPLKYFGAKQFSYGVRATVWGRSQQFKSAFIHSGSWSSPGLVGGGHAFVRSTSRSYPIEMMFGPSVPREMLRDEAVDTFESKAAEILVEVQRLLLVKGL